MATKTNAAAPAKSSGFKGVKNAFVILVICCVAAYSFYFGVLGNPSNFAGGDTAGHPLNMMGIVYKGGIVVGVVVLIELAGLEGRARIGNYRLESAICYPGK